MVAQPTPALIQSGPSTCAPWRPPLLGDAAKHPIEVLSQHFLRLIGISRQAELARVVASMGVIRFPNNDNSRHLDRETMVPGPGGFDQ